MAMPRESTFLPTIKCSVCGNDVEISLMGDHVCTGDAPSLPSLPDNALSNIQNYGQNSTLRETHSTKPAALDVGAANRPFIAQDSSTPGLSTGTTYDTSPMSARLPPEHHDNSYFRAPQTANPILTKRPGAYGGFGDEDDMVTPSADTYMNRSITPGPFGSDRPPSAADRPYPRRKESLDASWRRHDRTETMHSYSSSVASTTYQPSRFTRQNGYGGFDVPPLPEQEVPPLPPLNDTLQARHDSPSAQSFGSLNRSETYPKPSLPVEAPVRQASYPVPFAGTLPQHNVFDAGRRPSMGPDTSRPPPPRTTPIRPSTSGNGAGQIDLAAEFGVGNPYHTPSDSASSGYSTFSAQPSHSSSQTSPARSQVPRKPSESSRVNESMSDVQSSMQGLRTYDLHPGAISRGPVRTPSPLAESPLNTSPRSYNYNGPAGSSGATFHKPQQPFGQYDRRPSAGPHGSPPSPYGMPPLRKTSTDPLKSRGDCKACRMPITGKSVSSADGRLTGKYHKACFVCTTCAAPFTSAEFYVLSDQPYCEQHYHKLNGSLCGSCHRGIEGQYLEDEAVIKYHVGCFRCLDCGYSLSDGYFEVDGGAYCEQDALARTQVTYQPGPPPLSPSPYGQGFSRSGNAGRSGSSAPPGPLGPPRGGTRPSPRGMGPPGRPGPGQRGPPPAGRPGYGPNAGMRPAAGNGMPTMNKRMTRIGNM